jgi:hypothetical protein
LLSGRAATDRRLSRVRAAPAGPGDDEDPPPRFSPVVDRVLVGLASALVTAAALLAPGAPAAPLGSGLTSDEAATVALFKQAAPSVVYITTLGGQRGRGWRARREAKKTNSTFFFRLRRAPGRVHARHAGDALRRGLGIGVGRDARRHQLPRGPRRRRPPRDALLRRRIGRQARGPGRRPRHRGAGAGGRRHGRARVWRGGRRRGGRRRRGRPRPHPAQTAPAPRPHRARLLRVPPSRPTRALHRQPVRVGPHADDGRPVRDGPRNPVRRHGPPHPGRAPGVVRAQPGQFGGGDARLGGARDRCGARRGEEGERARARGRHPADHPFPPPLPPPQASTPRSTRHPARPPASALPCRSTPSRRRPPKSSRAGAWCGPCSASR